MIVFCHVYSAAGYPDIALNWVASSLDFLYGGIPLFFVLSGFCLYYPLTKPGSTARWGQFFRRRVHRLIPPYYITIVVVILLPFAIEPIARLAGLVVTPPSLPSWQQVWMHVLLLHTLSPDATYFYGVDSTFWTLPIEWQFYLTLPLAALVLHRWRWRGALGIVGVTLGYRVLLYATPLAAVQWPLDVRDLFPGYWSSFALGMLVAQRVRQAPVSSISPRRELAHLLGAVCIFLLLSYFMYGPARQWQYNPKDILFGGFFSVLLYLVCTRGSTCGRLLAARPLVWLGTVSYSLYLIHYPIIFALTPSIDALQLGTVGTLLAIGAITVPVTLLASAIFFRVVERPFLNAPRPSAAPSAGYEAEVTLLRPSASSRAS
jgi:peptidoglycan/LPS O-acetylase OafA/YrhL